MENSSDTPVQGPAPTQTPREAIPSRYLLWGGLALVVAILVCTVNSSALVLRAGFFTKLLAVIVGSAVGLAGALIGDAIRKFAHPDAVYTTGGMLQLIWIKLFWRIGPQVIGLVAGVLLGVTLVLK